MKRIIFVTGTGTGVGKTVVTWLLLQFLRQTGIDALAMKPFATGDRGDVERLQSAQGHALPVKLINPFFFPLPVAPMVAAQHAGRRILMTEALRAIQRVRQQCDLLLVEGAGGLLAPLGAGFFTAENLIASLNCDVIVVASNRLGTLNHTALVMRILSQIQDPGRIQVVLNQSERADQSGASNAMVLRRWLRPVPVREVPFLGKLRDDFGSDTRSVKKLKKVLATILQSYILPSLFRMDSTNDGRRKKVVDSLGRRKVS